MKFKRAIFAVAAIIAALSCVNLGACGNAADGNIQPLDYTESTAKINNPDQGFYRPISVKVTESGVTYNKNIVNSATQLYHLRIDISAFSQAVNGDSDKPLTAAALDGIDELLSYLKSQEKNAVVRFAYDPSYNGNSNKEPSIETISEHIRQVCAILDRYENTVTAIEAGLIGPWGEMHTSAVATPANISSIIDEFLTNTESMPVLVRTPKMIYDYLGISVNDIDGYTIASTHKAYRLGVFNDGYLGSDTDLGTYTDRQREVEFLSGQTAHLPYGGEVVVPTSDLHNIEVCLPEMNKLDLSYLDIEWNNEVIAKWENSYYSAACGADKNYYGATAFTYIENHLGYRFVLTKSVIECSNDMDELSIELTFDNVGFGNLNRAKSAKVIVAGEDGSVAYAQNVQDFTGEKSFDCALDIDLESGAYDVYLCVFGEEAEKTPIYCIQFANDGLWNAELKANKIGSIEVVARA